MSERTPVFRVTERFALPNGRVGVTIWTAQDPEQLEQQLRTRVIRVRGGSGRVVSTAARRRPS